MSKKVFLIVVLVFVFLGLYYFLPKSSQISKQITKLVPQANNSQENPLSIEYMRKQKYPGSDIIIEETLSPGSNYNRYIASYKSDGLKIYALLTVPRGDSSAKPQNDNKKYPVIIFNHGYIPPAQYRTTERYIAYTDAFSRNGYIVFKPDYRGNGNSEGNPEGAYYSPAYARDVLNAVSSIKKLKNLEGDAGQASMTLVDSSSIGMWGHSMGGNITLRAMVVSKDIKVGVIWGGVVADYKDLAINWKRAIPFVSSEREVATRRNNGRQQLLDKYGDFDKNPDFWHSIAPIYYVKDLTAPIQLHHSITDEEVPLLFSQRLDDALKNAGKTAEFYTYVGDDHNISHNLSLALDRSVAFFDKYLK